MKKLSTYLFLIFFSFSAPSFADDIRDFQIEGMSIGDSLLDYFNETEIINSKADWYVDNKYTTSKLSLQDFENFRHIDVSFLTKDKLYRITGMSAIHMKGDTKNCN